VKRLLILLLALSLGACATFQLPKDATVQQRIEATCSDLQSSLLAAQTGLYFAKATSTKDFTKAQRILDEASQVLSDFRSKASTQSDLVGIKDAILFALGEAAKARASAR
jgi:hypothetical protein